MTVERRDGLLLAVAVLAASTAAALIRQVHAPALTIAFWRCALGAAVLTPFAVRTRHRFDRRERRLVLLAGVLLAMHFATWIEGLSYTSVASAVALVSTQPVWAAMLDRANVERRVWVGILVALAGAIAVTGVDVTISSRAITGDVLALVAAVLAASYVTTGAAVRHTVPNAAYAASCYGVAAGVLLAAALASGADLDPHRAAAWGWLALITLGPQLLGHTVINAVIGRLGAVVVSVSLLFQVVGAAIVAWLWLDEAPKAATYPATLLLIAGVLLVVRHERVPEPAVD